MPNKTVPAWTQVPVTASELVAVYYDRTSPIQMRVTTVYEVKDNVGAIRASRSLTQTIALASYPVSAATLVAAVNTAEGT